MLDSGWLLLAVSGVMAYWLSYDNQTIDVLGGRDQLLVTQPARGG
jgi:hypothetical protein